MFRRLRPLNFEVLMQYRVHRIELELTLNRMLKVTTDWSFVKFLEECWIVNKDPEPFTSAAYLLTHREWMFK